MKIFQIDTFYKQVDDAYFVIGADDLIQWLGEKHALGSVFSLYELHV